MEIEYERIKKEIAKGIARMFQKKEIAEEATRGGLAVVEKSVVQYFSIHGTVPNSVVAAKSRLCEDIHQHFITFAQNIKCEIVVPFDLTTFKGYDGKATLTDNIQQPFAISFGSEIDQVTRKFSVKFEEYIEQHKKVSEDIGSVHQSIFPIFTEYMTEIMKIGDAIKWQECEPFTGSDSVKNHDKMTICFFGECGTGKSTDLTHLARIYKLHHKD